MWPVLNPMLGAQVTEASGANRHERFGSGRLSGTDAVHAGGTGDAASAAITGWKRDARTPQVGCPSSPDTGGSGLTPSRGVVSTEGASSSPLRLPIRQMGV